MFNVFGGYDIETTSFPEENVAVSYIQQIGLGSQTLYTRNISESIAYMVEASKWARKKLFSAKLVIWVHFLGYEWQFIRNDLPNIERVFFRDKHHPLEIETDTLIFRCSYAFTRLPLSKVAEVYTDTAKMDGEAFDYSVKRLPCTPLTFDEYKYCFYDIEVLRQFWENEIFPNFIAKRRLPLTSTGKIREEMKRKLRKYCNENGLKVSDYRSSLYACELNEKKYEQLKRAFYGGYTHANGRGVAEWVKVD